MERREYPFKSGGCVLKKDNLRMRAGERYTDRRKERKKQREIETHNIRKMGWKKRIVKRTFRKICHPLLGE